MPDAAPRDSRANLLYAGEHAALTWREAWRILVKSWPFVSRYRRLVALKCALVFVSLTFFLMTPWPLKIVIDNVIDGHPLTGIPAAILTPLVGASRSGLLLAVTIFLALMVILIGMVAGDAQSLGTNVNSGGLDQAGMTANDANDGGSLWNGLFGYLESRVTIDLTQRMNQSLRTAIYERFLRSPLALYADQKIGDAVFRVMYDSASIGPVFYRGVLAPIMSVVMFVMAMIVLSLQFSNEPGIIIVAILFLPVIAIGSTLFGRAIRDQSQSMRETGSNVMAAFEERVAQVQLIKAFGQEARETAVVEAASWASYRSTLRMLAIIFVLALVLAPISAALIGYAFYYLMMQVIAGRMTLGDIVLLASYLSMLANPMAIIGSTWASMQGSVAGLRRVHSVLDNLAEPVADGSGGGLDATRQPPGIQRRRSRLRRRDRAQRRHDVDARRRDGRAGGTERMRQDDAHPFDSAVHRTVGGNDCVRRRRFARRRARLDSRARRLRLPERIAVLDFDRGQHPLWQRRRVRDRRPRGGRDGRRRGIYRSAARRILDDARTARRPPVGRTETANRNRARPASTPRNNRPRRARRAARSRLRI